MVFTFYKPVNQNEFGLPREIKHSRDEWYIFKAEITYKPFFPRNNYTSLGHGWWYVNETGDYLYSNSDKEILLYSTQKDTELVVEPIYRFKEQR